MLKLKHMARAMAKEQMLERARARAANEPVRLLEMSRPVRAAEMLLEGVIQEYLPAVMTGRQEVWARMAHSIVDLLAAEPTPKVESRDTPRQNGFANSGGPSPAIT